MINKTIFTGRLTRDPEMRFSPQGTAITNFTLAVTRAFDREKADFPNIVCFKKLAELVANYTQKGSLVGVEGRLQTRSYDGQNGKVYVTEIIADNVTFLEPKSSQNNAPNTSQGNQSSNQPTMSQQANTKPQEPFDDPFGDSQPVDFEDGLPF